jgi:hypothetical protein
MHSSLATLTPALLELDLEAGQRVSRRVGPLTNISEHRKELAATERAKRSTLNEIAASLGVSRSIVNRILDEPSVRDGGRRDGGGGQSDRRSKDRDEHSGAPSKRHEHGVGRRRHGGAATRRRRVRTH